MNLPSSMTRQVPLLVLLFVWSGLSKLTRALSVPSPLGQRPALLGAWCQDRPNAVSASGVLMLATIQLNVARVEAMFWVTGCLTYFVPIGLFAYGAAATISARQQRGVRSRQLVGLILIAVAASCSESISLTAVVFLVVLLAMRCTKQIAIGRVVQLVLGLCVVTIVFFLVAFSPGHIMRKGIEEFVMIPALHSLVIGMHFTTTELLRITFRPTAGPPLFLIGLSAGLLIRAQLFPSSKVLFKLLSASAFVSLWAGHTMALLGTGQPLINRALTATFALFAALILLTGVTAGQRIAVRIPRTFPSYRLVGVAAASIVLALFISRPVLTQTVERLSQHRSNETL
jgi:hypothetical protein